MAEGILRHLAGDSFEVHSAGSHPAGYVHPRAIEVMKEIGVDISANTSKNLKEFLGTKIDTVITVCGRADQACPAFPGQVNRYHWGFDDPSHAHGTGEEILAAFRRVRDQIRLVMTAYAVGYREGKIDGGR
jgi:arsenate reductase